MTARITPDDIVKAGYCMRGARRHCPTIGVDLKRIIRGGLPVEEVEHIDDLTLQNVIAVAKARTAANG